MAADNSQLNPLSPAPNEPIGAAEGKAGIDLEKDFYESRIANYLRNMANSQRIQDIASKDYKETKRAKAEMLKNADAMGVPSGANGTTAPPTQDEGDGMEIRMHSPQEYHYHYAQPAQAVAAPQMSEVAPPSAPTAAKKLGGLAKAGIGAALIATGVGGALGLPLALNGLKQFLTPAPQVAAPAPTPTVPQKLPDYDVGSWPPLTKAQTK